MADIYIPQYVIGRELYDSKDTKLYARRTFRHTY